jgi:hypothetical protein
MELGHPNYAWGHRQEDGGLRLTLGKCVCMHTTLKSYNPHLKNKAQVLVEHHKLKALSSNLRTTKKSEIESLKLIDVLSTYWKENGGTERYRWRKFQKLKHRQKDGKHEN